MTLRNLLSTTAASLALAFAAPAALAQDVRPDTAEPGPALWQVSDEDTTIYLFGTVHVLPDGLDWYDARIEQAFTSSSELVTEIDTEAAAASAQTMVQMGLLGDGSTLRSLMSEEDRAEYEEVVMTLGVPAEALDPYEPWFAALNLSMLPLLQNGYNAESGVELALGARAEAKTRGALETVEEQVALFDGLPMDAQLKLLDETVESVPGMVDMLDVVVQEWIEGDADDLAAIMNEEVSDPALYQRLLVDRNANWAEWIEQRLEQPGNVFIAVGAGHLAGEGSVQDQLEGRGLTVTRIWE